MSSPRRKRPDGDASGDGDVSIADAARVEGRERFGDDDQIRARAYELYLERGGGTSDEMEDWLRAEREYRERAQDGQPAEGGATEHPPPA